MAAWPMPLINAVKTYVHDGRFMPAGKHITIYNFVYFAAYYQIGPTPRVPENDPAVWRIVSEGHTALVHLNDERAITKPSSLFTCAVIIYACRETKRAWVHHSPSGLLSLQEVHTAIEQLGADGELDKVFVIVANRKLDDSYGHLPETIVAAGIPRSNVARIIGYQQDSFGIDNNGNVGFC